MRWAIEAEDVHVSPRERMGADMRLRRRDRRRAGRGAGAALGAAALGLAACAGVDIPETDEGLRELLQVYGPLEGRVVSASSGKGVANAEVVLKPENEPSVVLGRAETESDGEFDMDDFGPKVREELGDDEPSITTVVRHQGSEVPSRHSGFDWSEYTRTNDYEFEVVADVGGGSPNLAPGALDPRRPGVPDPQPDLPRSPEPGIPETQPEVQKSPQPSPEPDVREPQPDIRTTPQPDLRRQP